MAACADRCWAAQSWEDYARQAAFLGASVGAATPTVSATAASPLDGQVVNVTPSTTRATSSTAARKGLISAAGGIVRADEQEVLFALTSPDGDQGFPGTLQATATIV